MNAQPPGIPSKRMEQYKRALEAGDLTIEEIRAVEMTGANYPHPAVDLAHPRQTAPD